MLGHHSWAKNREPYANGMKAIFTAAWILFCLKVLLQFHFQFLHASMASQFNKDAIFCLAK
jgi:hypothetical protein